MEECALTSRLVMVQPVKALGQELNITFPPPVPLCTLAKKLKACLARVATYPNDQLLQAL